MKNTHRINQDIFYHFASKQKWGNHKNILIYTYQPNQWPVHKHKHSSTTHVITTAQPTHFINTGGVRSVRVRVGKWGGGGVICAIRQQYECLYVRIRRCFPYHALALAPNNRKVLFNGPVNSGVIADRGKDIYYFSQRQ